MGKVIIITLAVYFLLLLGISWLTGVRGGDNGTFFNANRSSRWYMVAFGMVGASISGVTFISVPGMVLGIQMTYLQMCIGFIFGYFAVAFLLLPIYYRLRLTTIYTFLLERIGRRSYKTGASFFLISKMAGAAVRFYIVCLLLHEYVLSAQGIPFPLTVVIMTGLIWAYTRRGGISTLVITDSFQTFCIFLALILIIYNVMSSMGLSVADAWRMVEDDPISRVFVFDDFISRQNFFKQFISGIFIVLVMTGLDQDMMQKNLTCKTLREAQKDMCTYGFAFLPANFLFLFLGVLLVRLAPEYGIDVASLESTDMLLPSFAATGLLGPAVVVLFTIGIVAASFSSADSALTALTTTCCIDIFEKPDDERLRHRTHIAIAAIFALFIIIFRYVNSTNAIDAIYTLCSYTYGPLLGLFAYGILNSGNKTGKTSIGTTDSETFLSEEIDNIASPQPIDNRNGRPTDSNNRSSSADKAAPVIAIVSPLLCFTLDTVSAKFWGYKFGYELLLINGLLTYFMLAIQGKRGLRS